MLELGWVRVLYSTSFWLALVLITVLCSTVLELQPADSEDDDFREGEDDYEVEDTRLRFRTRICDANSISSVGFSHSTSPQSASDSSASSGSFSFKGFTGMAD